MAASPQLLQRPPYATAAPTRWFIVGMALLMPGMPAVAGDLDGNWRGHYDCGGSQTALVLTIESSAQSPGAGVQPIEADFVFEVAAGSYQGAKGRFMMRGDYRPKARTLRLRPVRSVEMPAGFRTVPISGALAADGNTLSGRIEAQGCGEFSLQRGEADASPAAPTASTPSREAPAARSKAVAPAAKSRKEAAEALCGAIRQWIRPLEQVYPHLDAVSIRDQQVAADRVRPLFVDPNFVPFFGLTFSDLDRNSGSALREGINRCLGPEIRSRTDWSPVASALMRAFDLRRATMDQFVAQARTDRAWRERSLADLHAASPGLDAYQTAVNLSQALPGRDDDLWPGERAALLQELEAARRRHADAALASQVDRLLDRPPTLDSLHALSATLPAGAPIFSDASPAVAQREMGRMDDRRRAVLSELMAAEAEALDKRGTGLAALHAGLLWDEQFRSRYGHFSEQPPVAELHERFLALRDADLRAASSELIEQFGQQQQAQALDDYAGGYLDPRLDAALEGGRPLFAAIDERKKAIQAEQERSFFSARERALMASPGQPLLTVPASYPEPDAEEINLAMMREMTTFGGRMLSGTAVEVGLPPFDQFMPSRLELKKLDKQSCERVAGSPAYTCSFRQHLTMSFPERTRAFLLQGSRSPAVERLIDGYVEAMNSGAPPVLTHTFVLTPTGWRSPSMREQGMQAMVDEYTKMLAALPQCKLIDVGGRFICG